MLRAHVGMVKRLRFLPCEGKDLLDARCIGNASLGFRFLSRADLLFDGGAHSLQVQAHLLEYADSDALTQFDQSKQDMLSSQQSRDLTDLTSQACHNLQAQMVWHWEQCTAALQKYIRKAAMIK